jgi:hypothetical protein
MTRQIARVDLCRFAHLESGAWTGRGFEKTKLGRLYFADGELVALW